MAQPAPYRPQHDFSVHDTIDKEAIDTELANIQQTLDRVLANLTILQRDDGRLGNATVHPQALTRAALSLMAQAFNPRNAWAPSTDYQARDTVVANGETYICVTAHTSAPTFAPDAALGRWMDITAGATVEMPPLPTANGQWALVTADGGISYSWAEVVLPGLVRAADIASNAITTDKIVNATILGEDIAAGTIGSTRLIDGTITAEKLGDMSVTNRVMTDSSISTAKLRNDSVTSEKIVNNTIVGTDLKNNTLTSLQIAADAITPSELKDATVSEAKLTAALLARITALESDMVELKKLLPLPSGGDWKVRNTAGSYSWTS